MCIRDRAFTVPAATCVAGPNTNPAIPQQTVQDGLNNGLALPNSNATSALQLVAGAVPPPPSTTTTTIPPTTTTVPAEEEAEPASAVAANARFTG